MSNEHRQVYQGEASDRIRRAAMKCFHTIRSLSFCLVVFVCLVAARTSEFPSNPILRIEPATHIAPIRAIDADRTGRWLVSVSEDKTARVWDASTGLLERVLRPPIGDGQKGQLYSVAISPNGRLVACGEYTHEATEQL